MDPRHHVFVSYKTAEANLARAVVEVLLAHGLRVWFAEYSLSLDKYFADETEFMSEIFDGIDGSAYALLFTSRDWARSRFCRAEWEHIAERQSPDHILRVRVGRQELFGDGGLDPRYRPLLDGLPRCIQAAGEQHCPEVARFVFDGLGISPNQIGTPVPVDDLGTPWRLIGGGRRVDLAVGGLNELPLPVLPLRGTSFPGAKINFGGQLASLETRLLVNFQPVGTIVSIIPNIMGLGGGTMSELAAESKRREDHRRKDRPDPLVISDNQVLYREYARHAQDWYEVDKYAHRGLHLWWSPNWNGFATPAHMAITFVNPSAGAGRQEWHRFYAILLRDPIGGTVGELDLSFAVHTPSANSEESLRAFCELTPFFDAVAGSVEYLGEAGASPFAPPDLLSRARGLGFRKCLRYWSLKPAVNKLRAKKDIDTLIWALGHEDGDYAENAARSLLDIGAGAVAPLIAVLSDTGEEWRRRMWAAQLLGRLGTTEAIPYLIAALSDPSRNVRQGACWGLQRLRAPGAVGPLIELLNDADTSLFTRGVALESLLELASPDVPEEVVSAIVSLLEHIALWQQDLRSGRIPGDLNHELQNAAYQLQQRGNENVTRSNLLKAVRAVLQGFVQEVMLPVFKRLGQLAQEPVHRLIARSCVTNCDQL